MLRFSPIILPCLVLLLVEVLQPCHGLSAAVTPATLDFATMNLASTGPSQLAIVDGGEWSTVQALLQKEGRLPKRTYTKRGYMKIVTGKNDEGQRVVGMMMSDSNDKDKVLFEDSVAMIPSKVSDMDAISTYISALSTVHCALPQTKAIGGSSDAAMINRKAVVLGSNVLACFAAEGLASLGLEVSLISTGNPKVNSNVGNLQILKPAVGDDEIGFSSYIGEFDSLVDTISNELKGSDFMMTSSNDEDDEDDFEAPFGSSILGLLKSRHNCQKYISTETECQKIVAKEGIFGGPGKADNYCKNSAANVKDCTAIPPPQGIGSSMTALLEKGILLTQAERKKLYSKSDVVRGWSLGDFWENTRWPRDSSGSSDVRFGLPVISDEEEEDETNQAELMARYGDQQSNFERLAAKKLGDVEPVGEAPQPPQNNPHVFQINGVSGVNNAIVNRKKHCILFLSARFCQTCKRLDPKYTRLARMEKDKNDSSVLFAKAEMGSAWGKQLGRHLQVDAVPAFVLFREGKQFGEAISISDLPSNKIEQALDLLESDREWDPKIAN